MHRIWCPVSTYLLKEREMSLNAQIREIVAVAEARMKDTRELHAATIEPAERAVSVTGRRRTRAEERLRAANCSHDDLARAYQLTPDPELKAALDAAATEKATADTAFRRACSAVQSAETRVLHAQAPLMSYEWLIYYVRRAETAHGGRAREAEIALGHAKQALTSAKSSHPRILAAEAAVQAALAPHAESQADTKRLEQSLQHVRKAQQSSNTAANRRAVARLEASLRDSVARLKVHTESLAQAQLELEAALEPVKADRQLVSLVEGLVSEARRLDAEYAREQERLREEARRQAQYERDSDPCTCSETTRCWYCIDRQNRSATGQDREPWWTD